jgi:hypothetical protein
MENLLIKIPDAIQLISLILTILTLAATVIVRLTPTKTDDIAVGKFSKVLLKVLTWLPTLGINPRTKKLEEEIYELREKTNPGVSDVAPSN